MDLKVLIVEDENLLRSEIVLTTPWEKFSLEVIGEADNGLDGERLINELKPDIVITDIRMPGIDGITMIQKTNPPASIILTGYDEFGYAQKAIKLGVRDFIVKPIDDDEFYSALKKLSKELIKIKEEAKLLIDSNYKTYTESNFKEFISSTNKDKGTFYIDSAILFIKNNYKEDISLLDIASHVGINESYISSLFKEKTNYCFLEYLMGYRIKKAMELFRSHKLRINEVARESGFQHMSYFSRIFRKHVGVSPSQYIIEQGQPDYVKNQLQ